MVRTHDLQHARPVLYRFGHHARFVTDIATDMCAGVMMSQVMIPLQ